MRTRTNPGIKLITAKLMRRSPTRAEARAWALLRDRRCLGLKFRRQHVLHGFVADFYCAELKLVFEIDGAVHSFPDRAEYDAERTWTLERHGYHIVRIRNRDVSREKLPELLRPFHQRPPSPALLERGSGGEARAEEEARG